VLFKLSRRSFLAHKGTMLLSLASIVLSVAFVAGTLLFTDTATSTFNEIFGAAAADVAVSPNTPSGNGNGLDTSGGNPVTLPASTLDQVARVPGVATALGEISVSNASLVDAATGRAVRPQDGGDTLVGAWVPGPRMPVALQSGSAPTSSNQIVLDSVSASRFHLAVGSTVKLINPLGSVDLTVSGIASFTTLYPDETLGYLTVAAAQHDLLGATGVYTSVNAYGGGSVDDTKLASAVGAAVGGGYKVQTAAQQAADKSNSLGGALSFIQGAMLGFAAIALLVGIFLIVNTFSMLVARRTREIGLLRALGGTPRQANLSVLMEALLLGVVGGTVGMVLGVGVALGMIKLMTRYGLDVSTHLHIGPDVPAASYAVGVVVTMLAAWIPSRHAGRVSPMAALRDHGIPTEPAAARSRLVWGLVLLLTGGAATGFGAFASNKGMVRGGAGVALIGLIILSPVLVTAVIGGLGRLLRPVFGTTGRLAVRNAVRSPRRTGATAASLMIGLALATGFSVTAASMKSSASAQVDQFFGADYLILPTGADLTPAMVAAAAQTPGIAHVTEEKRVATTITAAPGAPAQPFTLNAVTPSLADDFRVTQTAGDLRSAITGGGISIDQHLASAFRLSIGSKVSLDYGDGHVQSVPVDSITKDGNPYFDGDIYIGISTVAQVVPSNQMPPDLNLFAMLAPGASETATYTALQNSLAGFPQAQVEDRAAFKNQDQRSVQILLGFVYAMLALAIIVALLGVVNTLALSVTERTREIGLLRAVGLSRRQLRRMVRIESALIAIFGALTGTAFGLGWGIADQHSRIGEGLSVLSVPIPLVLGVLAASLLIGLLAAQAPALRAGRLSVLGAIASE
jgi:putative ABC transport system permease protein